MIGSGYHNNCYKPNGDALWSPSQTPNESPTISPRLEVYTKSNQIYYIDHPLFGVLIKITPIQNSVGVKS